MSTNPEPNAAAVEQVRRQVNKLAEEIAHLSETEVEPAEYFGEFLQRVLSAVAAPAGAVWIRTAQGNLQLQYQIRMREVGIDQIDKGREVHDQLLRQAVVQGKAALLAPQSGLGSADGNGVAPGNPTNFVVLIAPIMVERQVAGLVEIWQDPRHAPEAQRGFLQFIVRMSSLAAGYTRNYQLRQMTSQQQVWTQLEAFSRNIHSSLNPTEVAYLIANEGRRLIGCDRVCVGLRDGKRTTVRAISGADVIEKRSNLVQLMRRLFDEVLRWGERLNYTGSKDDSLPPRVLRALDAYLEESNSKLLVVAPLRDTRETNTRRPARSVLMMESFEPSAAPEQLTARMEVVTRHAASALYNAWEYRKIPFRFVWVPLAKIQEGLGGKAKAITLLVTFAVVALITLLTVVPYPLKMDAKGELLPVKRAWIYSPLTAQVVDIKPGHLRSGDTVSTNQEVLLMQSFELEEKIRKLRNEMTVAKREMDAVHRAKQLPDQRLTGQDNSSLTIQYMRAEAAHLAKGRELMQIQTRINADLDRPGYFWLKPPISGVLLTSNFREHLINRQVTPQDPLLRFGDVSSKKFNPDEFEVELKIPQKHIGHVLAGYKTKESTEELDVDFLLQSQPTWTFRGKLARGKIAFEATPDRTDNNEADAVVLAWVRVSGKDIATGSQIPPELLRAGTGTGVNARVRCGHYPMGYSLFYGVWEFIYEKVVFFF